MYFEQIIDNDGYRMLGLGYDITIEALLTLSVGRIIFVSLPFLEFMFIHVQVLVFARVLVFF